MFQIEQAYTAAWELAETGGKPRNVKLAIWAGILSANNGLERNGRQVRLVARFAETQANEQQLRAALRREGYITGQQINGMLEAQALYHAGKLDWLLDMPDSWQAWVAWRDKLAKLYSVGYKVASFIALLLYPLDCPFAIIDRHVIRRLNIRGPRSGKLVAALKEKSYKAWEQKIAAEAAQASCEYPLGIWHWYTWEQQRNPQATSAESHAALACTLY